MKCAFVIALLASASTSAAFAPARKSMSGSLRFQDEVEASSLESKGDSTVICDWIT
jgi:hypothetical protein